MSDASMYQHDFTVLSTPEHVPIARRETTKILTAWDIPEETITLACLIVSELVTNVVQHAAILSPTATISLQHTAVDLALTVHDDHPHRPRALPADYGSGGRGLLLVRTLVEEAGGTHEVTTTDPAERGKNITVRLPHPPLMPPPSTMPSPPARASSASTCHGQRVVG
ncbi:ATP-binding protein [Streptomyces sp. NPDC050095]|uniref:ATP-binding protein n=1 Tax=unclassified Streptomyces TaxID=2593676 RepID=UPI0034205919